MENLKNIYSLMITSCLIVLMITSCQDKKTPSPDNGNKAPACNIISPSNNATFNSIDSIIVTVAASDTDGTIAKVELYVDNIINGNPKTAAPYTFTIAAGTLAAGSHSIKAIATDNKGATRDAAISVNINYVPTVYIGGYENNGHAAVAKYWKNGTVTSITDGTYSAAINSIFLSGNDIYAAGYEFSGNTQLAKYWKNGTGVTLGADASAANSIAVNGSNVYVGGWEVVSGFDLPRYWSNGTATSVGAYDPFVSQTVLGNGQCTGVYLKDNNVYSAGYYRNSQGRFSPWETTDGFIPANTIPNNDKHCFANAIFVSGSDKYVVGTQNNATTGLAMVTVWKNGVATTLTAGTVSVGVATPVLCDGTPKSKMG